MDKRPHHSTAAVVFGAALLILTAACGGGGGGPTSSSLGAPPGLAACAAPQFLTAPLVPVGNINFISPLGNLNPPQHTFPTDHIYLYMGLFSPIAAPSAIVVTSVLVQHRTGGGQPAVSDYALTFFPCADVMMQLGHVASLAAQLSAKVGSLDAGCGASHQTGGFTTQQCRKDVNIPMAAGEIIGMSAGTLDVWARDRRVTVTYANPSRLSDPAGAFGDGHVACPLDYFTTSIGDLMRAKLGAGSQRRTIPPVCGDVAQDVPNSAAGRWIRIGSPTYPEDPHLALVHDNVNPANGVFSVGVSIASLPSGVYGFTPATTGRVNLDFRLVTTVGELGCYQVQGNRRVLIQLTSATRLRIEGFGTGACGDPATWTMTAGAVEFER